MKKIFTLILLLLFTGCSKNVTPSLSGKVNDISLYSSLTSQDIQLIKDPNCKYGIDIPIDETKRLQLTNQETFNVVVYASPNSTHLNSDEFNDKANVISEDCGLEGIRPLKADDKHLFWYRGTPCGYEAESNDANNCRKVFAEIKTGL